MIKLGIWDEARHEALAAELEEMVRAANTEAQGYGILSEGPHHDPDTMFEDVYKEMPWHLREQQAELKRLRAAKSGNG